MSLSSLNLIGQTIFELESGNKNVNRQMDRQTDKKRTKTNGQTYTNFLKRNLAMMVFLSSMNSIGQTIFELESSNEDVDKQMDGQTNGQKMDKQTNGITPVSKET